MEKLLLRIPEAAEILGLSRAKLYTLVQQGKIPAKHIGRSVRLHVDDVRRFERRQKRDEEIRTIYREQGEERTARREQKRECSSERKRRTVLNDHLIYFLQDEVGGLIKIGIASNVEERTGEIQRMSPVPLRVLTTLPGSRTLEARLHARFAADRHHGEWFDPSPELVAFIAACVDGAEAQST